MQVQSLGNSELNNSKQDSQNKTVPGSQQPLFNSKESTFSEPIKSGEKNPVLIYWHTGQAMLLRQFNTEAYPNNRTAKTDELALEKFLTGNQSELSKFHIAIMAKEDKVWEDFRLLLADKCASGVLKSKPIPSWKEKIIRDLFKTFSRGKSAVFLQRLLDRIIKLTIDQEIKKDCLYNAMSRGTDNGLVSIHIVTQIRNPQLYKVYFDGLRKAVESHIFTPQQYIDILTKKTNAGFTPLHELVKTGGSIGKARRFFAELIWARDKHYLSDKDYCKLVLAPTDNGFTALHDAIKTGNIEIAQLYMGEIKEIIVKNMSNEEAVQTLFGYNLAGFSPFTEAIVIRKIPILETYLNTVHFAIESGVITVGDYVYQLFNCLIKEKIQGALAVAIYEDFLDQLDVILNEFEKLVPKHITFVHFMNEINEVINTTQNIFAKSYLTGYRDRQYSQQIAAQQQKDQKYYMRYEEMIDKQKVNNPQYIQEVFGFFTLFRTKVRDADNNGKELIESALKA